MNDYALKDILKRELQIKNTCGFKLRNNYRIVLMKNFCGVNLYLPRSFVFRQKTSGDTNIRTFAVTRLYMNGNDGFGKLVSDIFL